MNNPPFDLRCNNLVEPLGIDADTPELSWRCPPNLKSQSAWQIQAFDGDAPEKILWESGKIPGSSSCAIPYGGDELPSRQRVMWRCRIWDEYDQESPWSEYAHFEIGLSQEKDWECSWVGFPVGWSGRALNVHVPFKLEAPCRKARLYCAGLGCSYLWINGQQLAADELFAPAQSDYSKSWHYRTFDLTTLLQVGDNTLVIEIGAGWLGMPMLRFQLEADGQILCRSDVPRLPKLYPSAIMRHSFFGGEEYDARQEYPDQHWRLPGHYLPDSRTAMRVPPLAGRPRGLEEEPIRQQCQIPVVRWHKTPNGDYTADFGRNFTGFCHLKGHFPAGTRIEMRFAEVLNPDGTVNQANQLAEAPTDTYIAAGTLSEEHYEPRFSYHGFRYAQLHGYPGEPPADALTGVQIRTDCATVGDFRCSSQQWNDIFRMVRDTEACNLLAVPTDCPHRERMGWLNDMLARCVNSVWLFDQSNLMGKFLNDIAEAQDPESGNLPMTAPYYWGFPPDPVCSSFLEIALLNANYYGKMQQLRRLWGHFKRWTTFLVNHCDADGIFRNGGEIGDWCPPLKYNNGVDNARNHTVPRELFATALVHYALQLLHRIGTLLDKPQEELAAIAAQAQRVRQDFLNAFGGEDGRLNQESQSGYVAAIHCGLFGEDSPLAAQRLSQLLQQNDGHHTTGNVGTRFLLEVLSQYGYAHQVAAIMDSTQYPGWGYMLANGATTLWERWENSTGSGMNSHNHPMMGAPCGWFFRYPAGIQCPTDAIGFDHFRLSPTFFPGMEFAGADYHSRAGIIRSHWRREGSHTIRYDFEIPPNCRAMVSTPDGKEMPYTSGKYQLFYNL